MRGLFNFPVTKTREILLNDLSVFESFFEFPAVPRHSGPGVICDIEILCAAVAFAAAKRRLIDGATVAEFRGEFLTCFYRASEFDSFAIAFCPSADGFHFKTGIADRTAVRPEGFVIFSVSGIDGDIRL